MDPTETERLLLQVATNQATIALQEARRIAQREASLEIEQTRTKAMLQDSEARFQQMADSIPEMMQRIIDSTPALIHTALPDGDIDFFNYTWLTYVGLSLAEVQGWQWTTAIHPADVEGMVKSWRASLASGERGITINNVQPGPTDTDLNPATGEFADMLRKLMALPRYGSVDEIAAFVTYLAGPEAGFVTGASLTIDGGFTA